MAEPFCTLGTFEFEANSITIGARPRTVQMNTNCLATEPVQTVAYVSGHAPVTISGFIIGTASMGETAAECLQRLRSNLETEVAKDSNTLTIDWGTGADETYRVFKNECFDIPLEVHVLKTNLIQFTLTLNCLP